MLQISQLLERFKGLTNTDKEKKRIIVGIFKDEQIPISTEQISIQKNTVFIKSQPIIKTEIFLKKESLVEKIRKIKGLSIITEIR